ncbi:MAG: radical SAM protein [Syntrophorhabdaceae bacterium]
MFGPVPSRRLGYSLGVDIIPPKYCSYDCIYCQIGKTTHKEIIRRSFYDPQDIITQVVDRISGPGRIDFITFSGSGEPTLNADLGFLIRELKTMTSKPVAVITNGSLLCDDAVRKDLVLADIVLPSLDAVSQEIFERVNRPFQQLDIHAMIEGLKIFRREFSGQIWLEIMLIKNVNDNPEELERMAKIASETGVDRIQLNTVTRPPSEGSASRIDRATLEEICRLFGPKCEVIASFEKPDDTECEAASAATILETLKRRPLTLDDIAATTGMSLIEAKTQLGILEKHGSVKTYVLEDTLFYVAT